MDGATSSEGLSSFDRMGSVHLKEWNDESNIWTGGIGLMLTFIIVSRNDVAVYSFFFKRVS